MQGGKSHQNERGGIPYFRTSGGGELEEYHIFDQHGKNYIFDRRCEGGGG